MKDDPIVADKLNYITGRIYALCVLMLGRKRSGDVGDREEPVSDTATENDARGSPVRQSLMLIASALSELQSIFCCSCAWSGLSEHGVGTLRLLSKQFRRLLSWSSAAEVAVGFWIFMSIHHHYYCHSFGCVLKRDRNKLHVLQPLLSEKKMISNRSTTTSAQ